MDVNRDWISEIADGSVTRMATSRLKSMLSVVSARLPTTAWVPSIAFQRADDQGLLLHDMTDLQQTLIACAEQASELATTYGNISKASVGTIQRQLLAFESQGADRFFGEPAFEINDLIRCDENGKGIINVLAADKLMQSPKLYATFLLWLLAELFEALPEVGDPEKPKLVFFFDEAQIGRASCRERV